MLQATESNLVPGVMQPDEVGSEPRELDKRIADSKPKLGSRTLEQTLQSAARTEPAKNLLLEDNEVVASLERIVNRLTIDPNSRQDLLQECLLCLWRAENQTPGHTVSWYLQGCRFHVQHWLAMGRSLDSPKRAGAGRRITIAGDEEEAALADHHDNGELIDRVCVRDLIVALAKKLKPTERSVLDGLAAGLTLQEVASATRLSYPTVLKYRRKIAALAVKLDFAAPRPQRKNLAA
jgi:DNA-directed RNA polymerase specialized sigma24 family protein